MFAWAFFLAGHYLSSKRSASIGVTAGILPPSTPDEGLIQLTQLENDVVRVLAGGDGAWITLHTIARHLSTSNLMVEQALEKLHINNMIRDTYNYIDGTSYRLSSKGRDYVISQGYVPG